MHIHADMARLREGLPAQPLTDAALAQWGTRPDVAGAIAGLGRFAQGAALEDLPALHRLLSDADAASALVGGLVNTLIPAMQAEPLAQVPLGHATAPGAARLRLASHGRAVLTLVAHAPADKAEPASALFEDGLAHEIVVAGEGSALVHRLGEGGLTSRTIALAPGTRLQRGGVEDARQIITVSRPLLMLQLTREAARPRPAREIALANGRLIKTISGCKQTSQQMMALCVLGALRHAGALSAMAGLGCDQAAERDLRWEALRQTLAMDTRSGLELLARLAAGRDDPLQSAAEALQRQLAAACPDLAPFLPQPA
ncbi:MAG: hypothetical protein EDM03_10475 [Porphyrobacter sp. IPPAS B-1204]|nr:MAG: hypothetical protein EDM03_10475 [Porphyrobacter sp. IPPAS B-1204]